MNSRLRLLPLLLAAGGTSTVGCAGLSPLDYPKEHPPVCIPPIVEPPEPMTLPRFLGVDVLCERTAILARSTRETIATYVPVLEPHPLPKPLSHPDNAASPSPAVANVHKVKQAKAEAKVKAKAVAELAKLDCAQNPLVEEGLLAALDDPSADVRAAAAEAVLQSRKTCTNGCVGCCSPHIRAKLSMIVFQRTEDGCWIEPDSRVRRLARLALDGCGGPVATDCFDCQPDALPLETPPLVP